MKEAKIDQKEEKGDGKKEIDRQKEHENTDEKEERRV